MASSVESNLKLELMATGENASSWGNKTNVNLQMLAAAIAGKTPVTLSSGNTTLADTQYVNDAAKAMALDVTGVLTADSKIVIPSRSKVYVVRNGTSGSFVTTIGTTGGAAATIPPGSVALVWCDGDATIVVASNSTTNVNATTLGGVAAALYARLDVSQSFTKGQAVSFVTLTDGSTVDMDCTLSNNFIVTIAGTRTLTLTNPKDGQHITLLVVQDATGGRTLAMPAAVLFPNGTSPSWTPSPAGIDMVDMVYNQALDKWMAVFNQTLAASGGTTITLTIDRNENCVDVYARAGSPGSAVDVNVIVKQGVIVGSDGTSCPAMDTAGFVAASVIRIFNAGIIMGKGGRGANGHVLMDPSGADSVGIKGADAEAGGSALRGPGSGRTLIIFNASGKVWGGGGGGGAGRIYVNNGGRAASGGGGGGAGGGMGGLGGGGVDDDNATITGANGTNGNRSLISTAYGSAGAGANAGTAGNSASGPGGDWGSAGANGSTSVTVGDEDCAATNGGAAGKAIDLNGGTLDGSSTGTSNPNVKGAVA